MLTGAQHAGRKYAAGRLHETTLSPPLVKSLPQLSMQIARITQYFLHIRIQVPQVWSVTMQHHDYLCHFIVKNLENSSRILMVVLRPVCGATLHVKNSTHFKNKSGSTHFHGFERTIPTFSAGSKKDPMLSMTISHVS